MGCNTSRRSASSDPEDDTDELPNADAQKPPNSQSKSLQEMQYRKSGPDGMKLGLTLPPAKSAQIDKNSASISDNEKALAELKASNVELASSLAQLRANGSVRQSEIDSLRGTLTEELSRIDSALKDLRKGRGEKRTVLQRIRDARQVDELRKKQKSHMKLSKVFRQKTHQGPRQKTLSWRGGQGGL